MKSSDLQLEIEHVFSIGRRTQQKIIQEKHIWYKKWRAWKPRGNSEEVTWSGWWIEPLRESTEPEEQEPTAKLGA